MDENRSFSLGKEKDKNGKREVKNWGERGGGQKDPFTHLCMFALVG